MTVGTLKKILATYPDELEIMIRTDEGIEEFNVTTNVGIPDYWGDDVIYGDDISDFVFAALEEQGEDPEDEEAIANIISVYKEELTPKLILE